MINTETSLDSLNALNQGSMAAHLGIRITALTGNSVTGTMPVDERTRQPFGLLHGGASGVLVETLGSMASALLIDWEKQAAVGTELNVTHLRAARSGHVTGTARLVRAGRRLHVWQVDIVDDADRPVATGRLTTMVVARD